MNTTPTTAPIVIQVCAASLSFIASTTIVAMIRKTYVSSKRGSSTSTSTASRGMNQSPYRRLILGLSISDMLQSSALIIGPFISPKGTSLSPWAIGNVATCDAGGVLMLSGALSAPLYIVALCIYYIYIVKYRRTMTVDNFYRRIERKIHIIIILFVFTVCVCALATKSMNSVRTGSYCQPASVPAGCRNNEEIGGCDRGKDAAIYIFILGMTGIVSCLGIVIFWAMVCWHVIFRDFITAAGGKREIYGRYNPCACLCILRNIFQQRKPEEIEASYLARLYLRQVLVQASLYIIGNVVTYVFVWTYTAYVLQEKIPPHWLYAAMAFFYPFGGVFNILVYTRPNVSLLRSRFTEYSWIYAFGLIVKAGGELPSEPDPKVEETDKKKEIVVGLNEKYCSDVNGNDDNGAKVRNPVLSLGSNIAYKSFKSSSCNEIEKQCSEDVDSTTPKSELLQYQKMREDFAIGKQV